MNKSNNEGDQVNIDDLVKSRLPKEVIDSINEIRLDVGVSYRGGRLSVHGEMDLPIKLMLCLGGALLAFLKYGSNIDYTKFIIN